jgi:formimidoylglutamate deiminase
MEKLWFESALLRDGWADGVRVTIDQGRVAAVERRPRPAPGDECHAIALPGLCNVHSHAFQRALTGLTERAGPAGDNFWTWREAMYRFLDVLDPDGFEAISAFAFMEMLERGFTRVGEFHYVHHDEHGARYANPAELAARIAAACERTGLGLTLLPVMYAHANFGGLPPVAGQRRFINDVDQFARLLEGARAAIAPLAFARLGVAPHSLRAVTPEELQVVAALAPEGPVHIHAAEQVREVEDSVAWSGRRPVEWLLENVALDARWTVIHATHVNAHECEALARSGAVAGLCPVTEANLGDGIFPAAEFLAAGGQFGVGSDSNVLISPAEELRALEYSQRLKHRARNVLASAEYASTGRRLFESALAGGARSLGVAAPGLAPGALADIVTLNAGDPRLAGLRGDGWLDAWIFGAGTGLVDSVWSCGIRQVERGVHRQREDIARRYAATLARVLGG